MVLRQDGCGAVGAGRISGFEEGSRRGQGEGEGQGGGIGGEGEEGA